VTRSALLARPRACRVDDRLGPFRRPNHRGLLPLPFCLIGKVVPVSPQIRDFERKPAASFGRQQSKCINTAVYVFQYVPPRKGCVAMSISQKNRRIGSSRWPNCFKEAAGRGAVCQCAAGWRPNTLNVETSFPLRHSLTRPPSTSPRLLKIARWRQSKRARGRQRWPIPWWPKKLLAR
jgi:hypothetical protein